MRALRQVFPGAHVGSSGDSLKILAAQGFLLLDSIPFAMNYKKKRPRRRYDKLVGLTATTYLQTKIDSSALEWSPEIRIAFAVKRNACSILRLITQLTMGGRHHSLSSRMIAVNRAGNPDASKLREIYGLPTGNTA